MKAIVTNIVESSFEYNRVTYRVFFYNNGQKVASKDVDVVFENVTSPTALLDVIDNAVISAGATLGITITSAEIIKA